MPVNPVSSANVEHYPWGTGCDGWRLAKTTSLMVIEERMPPGTSEVRHWHTRATQFFYVLDGTLTMAIEESAHALVAGVGIEIPPGVAHQARNTSDGDVRFLVISSPPHQGDRQVVPD